MLVMTGEDVRAALSYDDCIEAIGDAMVGVSTGAALMPLRTFMHVPGSPGRIGWMPGAIESPRVCGIKVVAKYPTPGDGSRGSHVGVVLLFDSESGDPIAALDGAMLTAIRTAAASAVATRALARSNARRLLVVGAGEQAWHHAHAIARVRPLEQIVVWGRTPDKVGPIVRALGRSLGIDTRSDRDLAGALARADVVCTLTTATAPVLRTRDLPAAVHLNLVGAAVRTSAEIDADVVRAGRYFVDSRASALAQAGELINALETGAADEGDIVGEIGEVLAGRCAGRTDERQITVYRSLGVAAQDLAAGAVAVRRAIDRGIGTRVAWSAPPMAHHEHTPDSPPASLRGRA